MIDALKSTLRRTGLFYHLLQRAYYRVLFIAERSLFGSRLHVWVWRYVRKPSREELERSIGRPQRQWMVDAVRQIGSPASVLEVGCNAGANLIVFARAFPNAHVHGIDISPAALAIGRREVQSLGLADRVSYEFGGASDLGRFAAGSFDLTMSDAVLMYVGPDDIGAVLEDMWRIARVGLVLNEWSLPAEDSRNALWWDLHWVHNYHRLLRQIDRAAHIHSVRVPPIVLGGPGWEDYGTTFVMTRA